MSVQQTKAVGETIEYHMGALRLPWLQSGLEPARSLAVFLNLKCMVTSREMIQAAGFCLFTTIGSRYYLFIIMQRLAAVLA